MTTKTTGGAAFPRGLNGKYEEHDGMSLRDWFAGQVITGYIATGAGMTDWAVFAHLAYQAADAMIAERSK